MLKEEAIEDTEESENMFEAMQETVRSHAEKLGVKYENMFETMQETVRSHAEKLDRYTAKSQPQSDAIKQPDVVELRRETNPRSSTQHYKGTGKEKTKTRVGLPAQPNPSYVTNARGKGKGKGGVTNTSGRGFGRGGGKGARQENNAPSSI